MSKYSFGGFMVLCVICAVQALRIEALLKEKERGALFLYKANLAEEQVNRFRQYPLKYRANYRGLMIAHEETGVPLSLLEAISKQENGGPFIELGNTKLPSIAYRKHYDPQYWAYISAGHTVAVYMGKYIWADEKRKRSFLKYLAKKYDYKTWKRWYNNVVVLEGK